MAYVQKNNPFRVGKSAFKQESRKNIKTTLDNTLKVSKAVGLASAMFDPVSMGTNDTTDGIDYTAPPSDAEKKRVAAYKKKNFSWYNPNRYF